MWLNILICKIHLHFWVLIGAAYVGSNSACLPRIRKWLQIKFLCCHSQRSTLELKVFFNWFGQNKELFFCVSASNYMFSLSHLHYSVLPEYILGFLLFQVHVLPQNMLNPYRISHFTAMQTDLVQKGRLGWAWVAHDRLKRPCKLGSN